MSCDQCTIAASRSFRARTGAVNLGCIACCLRWLSGMDEATMKLNAPVIAKVSGSDFMEKVRQAWGSRK